MPAGLPDLAAQPRGIDETPSLAAQFDQRVDRVDGGARDVVHHRTLVAGQPVQQRALADIRLAHQRHPARTAATRRQLGHRRQRLDNDVEQVGHAAAVHRADRVRLPQPQRPQRRGVGFAPLGVNLVGRQEHRLAGLAQQPRRGLVGRGRTDHRVDHQDDRVGGAHRHRRLLGHQLLQALGVGLPAAGVLHDEPPPAPQRVVGHPVAGHARHVLHHGLAASQDAVRPAWTCRRSAGRPRPPPAADPTTRPRAPRRRLNRLVPSRFRRPRCRRSSRRPGAVARRAPTGARSPRTRSCRWCRRPAHRRPPAAATPPASNPGGRGAAHRPARLRSRRQGRSPRSGHCGAAPAPRPTRSGRSSRRHRAARPCRCRGPRRRRCPAPAASSRCSPTNRVRTAGNRRHRRHRPGDRVAADLGRNILSVKVSAVLVGVVADRQRTPPLAASMARVVSIQVDTGPQHGQRHDPVHRAGVQIARPQRSRQTP